MQEWPHTMPWWRAYAFLVVLLLTLLSAGGVLVYGYYDTQAMIDDCLKAGGSPLKQNVAICVDEQGRIIQ